MNTDIQRIATLSLIDEKLDEMHEDLGDLPKEVKKLEKQVRILSTGLEETQSQLDEIALHRARVNVLLAEYSDKEAKLSDTQFTAQIKSNKEFDAITKEIEYIRNERIRIEAEVGQNSIREENLRGRLELQKTEFDEMKSVLTAKELELENLSSEQNEEFKSLLSRRKEITHEMDASIFSEYERIRTFHNDAAVQIRKGSCSGCFSAITPQRLVEMRNNQNAFYKCQSCGRILYPEHMKPEEEELG